MDCYYCDQALTATGSAKFDTWGERKVLVCRHCDRQALITRAHHYGVFVVPEERTDEELIDGIAAEKIGGEWLARLDQLPTDEAKRAAVRRLSQSLGN